MDAFSINYPGCNIVEGVLIIVSDNITNLNGLSMLTKVDTLIIEYNDILTSLQGLNNLDTVLHLYISEMFH